MRLVNTFLELYAEIFFIYQTSWKHSFSKDKQTWEMYFLKRRFIHTIIDYLYRLVFHKKETLTFNYKLTKSFGSMKRHRIIHVIGKIGGIGGSQKIIFDLICAFREKYDMEIVTLSDYMIYEYPQLKVTCLTEPEALKKYLLSINPSIIHLHYYGDWYGFHDALNIILALPSSIRIIENINTPIQAYRHKRILKYIYVSKFVKDLQKIKIGMVIYPGVDTEEYNPKRLRQEYMTAGFVYRLFKDKLNSDSFFTLVDLAKRDKRIKIIIVGYGEYFSKYFDIVNSSGVRGQFEFVGKIDYKDLPNYYKCFSLFLAPVYKESYGVVVPYAMSMNIPVVASRVDALPEILGDTNCLANDRNKFVKLAVKILNNRKFANRVAKNARKRVIKQFSLRRMLNKYDLVYQELITKKRSSYAVF